MARLEVGKTYPTRDGRVAKVVRNDGNYADIEVTNSVEHHTVFADTGKGSLGSDTYPFDLILPCRVRRVQVIEGPKENVDNFKARAIEGKMSWEKTFGVTTTQTFEEF